MAVSELSLYNLTCEQEENPLGIDRIKPYFSWKIHSSERGFKQSAYQVVVSNNIDSLVAEKGNLWNSKKVISSESILIPFQGSNLEAASTYYWRVRIWDKGGNASAWSTPQKFVMGLLSEADWGKACWIALEKDHLDENITTGIHSPLVKKMLGKKEIGMYKLPQFRKEFKIKKTIRQAIVYICGLGQFDLFLNGEKVGDHFLDPGWTKYDKEALYVSFDITKQLHKGNNIFGVMLGNGFYNIPRERYYKFIASYGAPKMKLHLRIEYTDNSINEVVSDASWKATESPITYSSIYGGEDYDATKEQSGWMMPGFKDKKWAKCILTTYTPPLCSQRATPVKIHDQIPVVRLFKNAKGNWIYDLGQNFSGILRITLKSKGSKTIRLHPAELLNSDSTVNQSASGSPYYFSYTTKGLGETETWQPQFSYYGFRYVQIEGAVAIEKENPDSLPVIKELIGLHTANSASEAGSFTCSNPMFNQIHNLIDWAIRSNMTSVLTDCPHREKSGWLEQVHLMQFSLQYRYNLSRLYEKIMNDMCVAQKENGAIPTIAPEYVLFDSGFEDAPEWGSAFIISPWYLYQWYGDKRPLEMYYPYMKHYMNYLASRADHNIVAYGLGDWYDIGPKRPGYAQLTSNGVTSTAIYFYNATIMKQRASLLGNIDDAKQYDILAAEIKKSFNDNYFNKETRKYDRDSQTANAIALYTDIVDEENKAQILHNLTEDLQNRNYALTAGDIGYRYVLKVLEENGASDIIYKMNNKYDVPGYGWQLAHGATALTESWQAYGFVSNNHFMLGHLMEWLYAGLGGIRQQEGSIAFHSILIDPQIVGNVRSAQTSYESPYGPIHCDWNQNESEYTLKVEIPSNCEALICLPTDDLNKVTEYGLPVLSEKEITFEGKEKDKLKVKVGSGIYLFTIKKP